MTNAHMVTAFLATSALAVPAHAAAAPLTVEQRLAAMEAEIGRLKSELAASRTAPAPVAVASPAPAVAETLEPRLAALEEMAAQPAPDGFKVGGTTIKLGGQLKLWSAVSRYSAGTLPPGAVGRDYYLPQQIPVGGVGSTHANMHVKQTRLFVGTSTPVGDSSITSYLEMDFQTAQGTQGSEKTTNGYNPALRRAYASWAAGNGTLLIGQDWTTFQNYAVAPETTDYVGPTEGSIYVRQPLVRYTAKLSKTLQLALAVENPETASISATSSSIAENDDDRLPDAVVKLIAKPGKAELSLAGILHEVRVIHDDGRGGSALGWGISGAGKIPFGPGGRHDLRFSLTWGEGVSHYLGLNFAADAVVNGSTVQAVEMVAGYAAVKLGWTDSLRSTVMAGFQEVDYPALLIPATANKRSWSVAGNLFWTPVKNVDFGVEYRHGERELLSGASGSLDRLEMAARYSF
jgi:hypothetical protein